MIHVLATVGALGVHVKVVWLPYVNCLDVYRVSGVYCVLKLK